MYVCKCVNLWYKNLVKITSCACVCMSACVCVCECECSLYVSYFGSILKMHCFITLTKIVLFFNGVGWGNGGLESSCRVDLPYYFQKDLDKV